MSNPPGSFIWYELMTSDAPRAAKFYGSVVGWTIALEGASSGGGPDYRMIGRKDGGFAGGVLALTDDMRANGAKPTWLGYLHVEDIAASTKAIEVDGGRTLMKRAIEVGEIAMVTDPMGSPFYVMKPVPPSDKPEAKSDVFDPKAAERVRWNELASPDAEKAKAFYSKHFGFELEESMPMGELGDYTFIDHGGVRIGAIMQQPAGSPRAGWQFYFGVPSIEAGKRAIESGGGAVLHGPAEVPGGDWIVMATDPDGAAFGLVGPRGE